MWCTLLASTKFALAIRADNLGRVFDSITTGLFLVAPLAIFVTRIGQRTTAFHNHPISCLPWCNFPSWENPYFFPLSVVAAHPPRQAEYASWSLRSALHTSAHWADSFSKTTVPSGKKRGLPLASSSDTFKAAQPAAQAAYAIGLMRRGVHAARQRGCFAGQ